MNRQPVAKGPATDREGGGDAEQAGPTQPTQPTQRTQRTQRTYQEVNGPVATGPPIDDEGLAQQTSGEAAEASGTRGRGGVEDGKEGEAGESPGVGYSVV